VRTVENLYWQRLQLEKVGQKRADGLVVIHYEDSSEGNVAAGRWQRGSMTNRVGVHRSGID
jgi:hypothetical protein